MNKVKTEEKAWNEFTLEEILKQNEKRIHYHIHRLGIHDSHQEFYTEGLYAMWMAYRKYEPNKGPLGTYLNYMIRNRLIDTLRKTNRDQEKDEYFKEIAKQSMTKQYTELTHAVDELPGSDLEETEMWKEVKSKLTDKQWNWVYYYIILDMPLKEIAEKKGVTVEAVKGWGKEVRRKLRGR